MRRSILLAVFTLFAVTSGCSQENPPNSAPRLKSAMPKSQDLKTRWQFFASKGPAYSMPVRRCWVKEGIPAFVGTLHIGLYPAEDFSDLIDFNLYQRYSSSVQQDLIETGKVDRSSFFPETAEEGVSRFEADLGEFQKRKNGGDIRKLLRDLRLPHQAGWVQELDFEEWEVSRQEGGLELTAMTKQGYLTMFIVDDK